MGIVYRATDTTFDRPVAVKVLLGGSARRFADEARITGQLQHPAIPPVHDLGTLPDGTPFLAMKLIKGETLDRLLKDRPDPAADRGRFIAAFEQVCQAVAYAHDHKVIHRDLKPANVMVGGFGEVQLMDWGLAKVLDSRKADDADPEATTAGTLVRSTRDSDDDHTQAGSVLGTPAFMPPEQALGAVNKVDARSDVFGLGGILASILTGQPPFASGSVETTRIKAAQGKVEECYARLDACDADPDMVALCKRCLTPDPAGRLANGGEVAVAVADLRAKAEERARRADLDRVRLTGEKVAADLRATEQKRRGRLLLTLAAVITVVILSGGATAWWAQKEAADRENQRRVAEDANFQAAARAIDSAEVALKKGNPVLGEIDASLDQADQRLSATAPEELRERLSQAQAAKQLLKRLDEIREQEWETQWDKSKRKGFDKRELLRTAFTNYGMDLFARSPEQVAEKVRRSPISARIQEGMDEWLRSGETSLVSVLALLDTDLRRSALRQAIAQNNSKEITKRISELSGRPMSPSLALAVAKFDPNIPYATRKKILADAQAANPTHYGLATQLGYFLFEGALTADGNIEKRDAIGYFRIAVALRPQALSSHSSLAFGLEMASDYAGAATSYREIIRLSPKGPEHHAHLAEAYSSLARACSIAKDFPAAAESYREAIRLSPNDPEYHSKLATALTQVGDFETALAEHRVAIGLDPKNGTLHAELALALRKKGDYAAAMLEHKEAIRIEPAKAINHILLAHTLLSMDDYGGALSAWQEGMKLDKKPNYHGFADGLEQMGETKKAVEAWRKCIQDVVSPDEKLPFPIAAFVPSKLLSMFRFRLAFAQYSNGDLDDAIVSWKEGLRLDPKNEGARGVLKHAERLRSLLPRLAAITSGKELPATPGEGCEFAMLSGLCGRDFVQAVKLYEKAFAAEPTLASDLATGHRYNAACMAARAARGEGSNKPTSPDEIKSLRRKLLEWLRADLKVYADKLPSYGASEREVVVSKLSHWLRDPDLRNVRLITARTYMTGSELAEWVKLWDDVKAVLAEAKRPMTKTSKSSVTGLRK
jgi:tetratricopeptide (TPR) repeat protein